MWPGTIEANIDVSSQESAQWVISCCGLLTGFQFATGSNDQEIPAEAVCLPTGQAVLYGDPSLKFSLNPGTHCRRGHFELFDNGEILIGAGRVKVHPEILETSAYRLYKEILDIVDDRSICRVWNYVPEINEVSPGLIENYKLFCSGRSKAFEAVFGGESSGHFPAASATGTKSDHLTVIFIATRSTVENWENPEQIPAYRYPSQYGPRAPAFARASRFTDNHGVEWIFISGTAAIKGHETLHAGNIAGQLELTLENVDIVLNKCGMRLKDCVSGRRRHFKAFLRKCSDLPILLDQMDKVMTAQDSLTVVEGDVCRKDLEVEIELTVFPFPEETA